MEINNKTQTVLKVKVKKLNEDAFIPTYGTEQAACMDLYAYCPTTPEIIPPHTTIKIHTGIAVEPAEGYMGLIFARSGMATKLGLRLANSVGVMDEDYRGEYLIAIHNDSDQERAIEHGTRIAQLMFVPYNHFIVEVATDLNDTTRGDGGFGSTGSR